VRLSTEHHCRLLEEIFTRGCPQASDSSASAEAFLLRLQETANALETDAQEAIKGSLAAVGAGTNVFGSAKSSALPQSEGQRQGGFDVLRRSLQDPNDGART
jgi:hypothetical protein